MIIERYLHLSADRWEKTKKDLERLVELINNSGGEYSLQLRENYFNIYYQGNSLSKVIPNSNGTYTAQIHERFVTNRVLEKLKKYSRVKKTTGKKSPYVRFIIEPQNLHQFFQRSNINSLSSAIRAVHSGEEITFEQTLITDNPPSKKFIIIDRQVADHRSKAQMDLLALKRDSVDRPFHFMVIEVKLGRNPELHEKVGKQLNDYIKHIGIYIKDYTKCYKENYRQKKELGLFNPFDRRLPKEIEIDEDKKTVEGLVFACGYSQLAKQALENLHQKIKEKRWDVKVQQMPRFVI
jgi:hypothetical protein